MDKNAQDPIDEVLNNIRKAVREAKEVRIKRAHKLLRIEVRHLIQSQAEITRLSEDIKAMENRRWDDE